MEAIVLREITKILRVDFPSVRLEAHPTGLAYAVLYVTVSHAHKVQLSLAAADNDTMTASVMSWTLHGDERRLISEAEVNKVGDAGVDLVMISKEPNLSVLIADPNSTIEIEQWMRSRIQALINYVNALANYRSTTT